jgi:arylsulfatase A-like enzyme
VKAPTLLDSPRIRRGPLGLAYCLALAPLLACGADRGSPNVLLITLDTTRADYLGCYGAADARTPNLDRLAAEGTRFDLAFSSAAVTPVSHASILTGLDNARHGVRVISAASGYRLPDDVPTLATELKSRGYATVAVHSAFPVSSHFGFARGLDVFDSLEGEMSEEPDGQARWDVARLQRRSDETTDRALRALGDARGPFFLWVHYWDPHDDMLLPPESDLGPAVPRDAQGRPLPSKALYASEVSFVDAQIGRLLEHLRQGGLDPRTLVVVVADHGEGLGDHGWQSHRILYQEQVRVPLIVRVPRAPMGEPVHAVGATVRTTDVFATLLDYAGIDLPRATDGRSLRPLIEGLPDEPRTAFFDQVNGYDTNARMVQRRPLDAFLYGVADGGWKLVWRPLAPEQSELYDLARDPAEMHDLFASEPEEARRLERLLARHGGWVIAPFPTPSGPGATGASASGALGALGYSESDPAAALDVRWAFLCPDHRANLHDEPRGCSACGAPLLPVARPAPPR